MWHLREWINLWTWERERGDGWLVDRLHVSDIECWKFLFSRSSILENVSGIRKLAQSWPVRFYLENADFCFGFHATSYIWGMGWMLLAFCWNFVARMYNFETFALINPCTNSYHSSTFVVQKVTCSFQNLFSYITLYLEPCYFRANLG
jgi:hypothetical protein